jgi:hypothetical protein
MFSSHRIRAGILVVVLDTTSRVPLPSMLPVGRAMRSFLVYGTKQDRAAPQLHRGGQACCVLPCVSGYWLRAARSSTHIAHSQPCIPSVTPHRVCISFPQILVSLIERKGSTAAIVYDRVRLHCYSHTDDVFH